MSASDQKPTLPPGEIDPNQLYIAVGRAIHAWENMESALARLYAKMTNLPEDPRALADYGSENKRFIDRIVALNQAAETYFKALPDQHKEGEFSDLLKEAQTLSIKRHRVAHGMVTMWGHSKLPENITGPFEIEMHFLYRWGVPFYSMTNLRTDPIGGNASSIEVAQKEFEALNNKIAQFTTALPKRP